MTPRDHTSGHQDHDREIVVRRTVGARRDQVFQAFTDAAHLEKWWGPRGFTTTTRSFTFHVGGHWDFVMHGPDGTDYRNWITWREIQPPEHIIAVQGTFVDDPEAFESTFTFTDLGETTEVTLRALFPTAAHRQRAVEEYHAVDGGHETLGRLADHLTQPTTEVG